MSHTDKMAAPKRLSVAFGEAADTQASRKPRRPAPPFSLRLSFEERARLEREAGEMPLGAYIRHRLFGPTARPPRQQVRRPVPDHQALGKVLGALGQSRLASNMNQLAKAAHIGSLPVTPETEEELREACAFIREMRHGLMAALGLRGEDTR